MKALMIAILGAGQAAPLDEFYKFKPETIWTYRRLGDGVESKVTGRVTGVDAGKVSLDWKDSGKDGNSVVTWTVVDSILTAEARTTPEDGDKLVLSFAVLKEGSKKDDRWDFPGGEFVHQGAADVTVPAGTYKNAVWTQFRAGEDGKDGKVDFYRVPKVGLAKIHVHPAQGGDHRFELVEFKEPMK